MYITDSKRLTMAGAKKMMAVAIGRAEETGIQISVVIKICCYCFCSCWYQNQ